MRIGIISTSALPTPPSGYGGIERLVAHLVAGLEELGHQVRLYAAEGSKLVPKLGLVTGAVEDQLGREACEDLESGVVDVVLDWSHSKPASSLTARRDRVISQAFWTDARGVNPVYPSRAVMIAFGGGGRVIYPGIDLSPYRAGDKEDYFIFFSRIIPEKGVERVISIAKMANVRLLVAGHTGEMAYDKDYVRKIKSMCDGKIEFVGDVSEEEKVELLSRARALLYWGNWLESFGIFVVEALACGTPCIVSSSSGGPAEIVVDRVSGFVCGGIDEFLRAMRMVDSIDPAACAESAKYFSHRRMSRDWDRLLREVVGGA
ncbi:MAG: glycosyltransferase [Nitrososphaerota archaeon]